MNILDINTFYYGSDGGIKTFYDAKINWFSSHPEHRYTLIHPGKKFKVHKPVPNVQVIEVFGLKGIIGKNRLLMIDYLKVFKMIRKINPDIIEGGDPLLTSLFLFFLKKFRLIRCRTACFHHSDPINTYIRPWAYGDKSNIFKQLVARICYSVFLKSHLSYDYSLVASQSIKKRLNKLGLPRVRVFPFGVDTRFSTSSRLRKSGEKRILFVGRLEHEKGICLIKKIIPQLLETEGVSVGVIGKGAHEGFFKTLDHQNFQYYGYIRDRDKLVSIMRDYTFFLAPGPYETFGIAVLEAISNGMVVVGADSGGTGEILSYMGSPFSFKTHDPDDFYHTVMKAIHCNISRESRRALETAGSFLSWDDSISRMIHFYHSLFQDPIIIFNGKKSTDIVA